MRSPFVDLGSSDLESQKFVKIQVVAVRKDGCCGCIQGQHRLNDCFGIQHVLRKDLVSQNCARVLMALIIMFVAVILVLNAVEFSCR